MLAGHGSVCWLSALGAGVLYNIEKEKNKSSLLFRVPVNKELLTGTVLVNKKLLTGTVPALMIQLVPSFSIFLLVWLKTSKFAKFRS